MNITVFAMGLLGLRASLTVVYNYIQGNRSSRNHGEIRAKTAPSKRSRRKWLNNSVSLKTNGGETVRLNAPG